MAAVAARVKEQMVLLQMIPELAAQMREQHDDMQGEGHMMALDQKVAHMGRALRLGLMAQRSAFSPLILPV